MLINDEAVRLSVYKDSKGIETIGVGHNLQKPISRRAAMVILDDDLTDAVTDLNKNIPWWSTLIDARQVVLANMCFNLGITRLLGFKNFLAAAKAGDIETACAEMKDSQWYVDVGARADRLIAIWRKGTLD
jgi:lysozyme